MDTVIRIRDENAGRFADVLALGAVIVFREENAGHLANDLAMGTGIRIRNRELLVAALMIGYVLELPVMYGPRFVA